MCDQRNRSQFHGWHELHGKVCCATFSIKVKKQTNNNKKQKQNRNTQNFSQDTKLQKHSQENNYLLNSKTLELVQKLQYNMIILAILVFLNTVVI